MSDPLEKMVAGARKTQSRMRLFFFLTGMLYGITARDASNLATEYLSRPKPARPAYCEALLVKDGKTGISIADSQGSYAAFFPSRDIERATLFALREIPRPLRRDALQEMDKDRDYEVTEEELVHYHLNNLRNE